jgi:hypothetical protein
MKIFVGCARKITHGGGPNLMRVMSAIWADIGDEERAKWNEKAKVARNPV